MPPRLSGSTAFTVAFVPTAMNAGVLIVPCGVVITPERPRPPGSDAMGTKLNVRFRQAQGAGQRAQGALAGLPPKLEPGQRDDSGRGGAQYSIADRYRPCPSVGQFTELLR